MTDFVISSGVTSSIVLHGGNTLTVEAGGESSGSVISSGATEFVSGLGSGDTLRQGAVLTVESGAIVSAEVSNFGTVDVLAGGELLAGSTNGGILNDFGTVSGLDARSLVYVKRGGVFEGGAMREHALFVQAGGIVSGVEADMQALIRIGAGAKALSDVLSAGSTETVLARGIAYRTNVGSGAVQNIDGVAVSTTVEAGGHLNVSSGGLARAIHIDRGHVFVSAGGTLSGATVSKLSVLTAESGSTVEGLIRIQGGATATISGAVASGAEISVLGGDIALGDVAAFNGMIAGLRGAAQQVDLLGFVFSAGETASWAQTGTSGTLTITDGAQVANLTLVGTYASGSFILSDDHQGGTIITHNAKAPSVEHFTQTAAVVGGGSATPAGHTMSGRENTQHPVLAVSG